MSGSKGAELTQTERYKDIPLCALVTGNGCQQSPSKVQIISITLIHNASSNQRYMYACIFKLRYLVYGNVNEKKNVFLAI